MAVVFWLLRFRLLSLTLVLKQKYKARKWILTIGLCCWYKYFWAWPVFTVTAPALRTAAQHDTGKCMHACWQFLLCWYQMLWLLITHRLICRAKLYMQSIFSWYKRVCVCACGVHAFFSVREKKSHCPQDTYLELQNQCKINVQTSKFVYGLSV